MHCWTRGEVLELITLEKCVYWREYYLDVVCLIKRNLQAAEMIIYQCRVPDSKPRAEKQNLPENTEK